MKRKICIVTGTRAEYGLLRWVMQGIKDEPELELQLIVTGMHLSPEFGLTFQEIERDGFYIDRKIEMLTSSDTQVGIAKSMGLGLIGFADAYAALAPDIVVVLGDRFEIFAAVAAAMVARIPIAHLHGGEVTVGAIDEAIRHSITKMSQLHFVAAEEYRRRVIQLGEEPSRVFLSGGLGVDSICRLALYKRSELEQELGFQFGRRNLLVTFHPVTLAADSAASQFANLLQALDLLEDTELIFTLPNADPESRELIKMLQSYAQRNPHAHVFTSLGQRRYFSCMAYVDGVVGNSSSGLLEAPTFKIGTVNIGDRQQGRLLADSVICCEPTSGDIQAALAHLFSDTFRDSLDQVVNPYGNGGASEQIVSVLKNINLDNVLLKRFQDVPFPLASA